MIFWITSDISTALNAPPRNDAKPNGYASLRGGALSAVKMSEVIQKE
ncbi:MAG: hypothetical protein LBN27_11900 [Prevotellaceae bacterium]|nr:hypothetical protein [Prevotellaceae bacterium]